MAKLDALFKMMKEKGASDLHVSSGSRPRLRLHGEMVETEYPELSAEQCQALIFEVLNEKQQALFVKDWELDCTYGLEGVARFRINVFMQRKGIAAVFRLIPSVIPTAKELGLPEQIYNLLEVSKGLILVTGPTGSGKSTTLAAMIDHINSTRKEHILTIEDPIEFVHPNKLCLVSQREVSSHTKSFAKALKGALREDPDIILVGELRDLETISLAITAAETGHIVFGTLHTNTAPSTVDRIIDVFPTEQQAQIRVMLAESLRGVISQTLFRKADGSGRVACQEILVNTSAIANLIREGKTFQIPGAMQTSRADGNIPYITSVTDLIKANKITPEDGHSFLGRKPPAEKPGANVTAAPAPTVKPGESDLVFQEKKGLFKKFGT